VKALADHVIAHHFPAYEHRYGAWLREVTVRTAKLVASWQAAGFVHGVLNTDNMSILGLTLDYGPYGFMEEFDPGFISNHSDHEGRYAFDQQPAIGLWNLNRLADALAALIPEDEATQALGAYAPAFAHHLGMRLRARLGLSEGRPEDAVLVASLLGLMQSQRVDYTRFFRALGTYSAQTGTVTPELAAEVPDTSALDAWLLAYRDRLAAERNRDEERQARMARVNPVYVLRNWLAERAIRRATSERDYSEIEKLRTLLKFPFSEHAGFEDYASSAPDWARDLVVSCSS